MNKKKNWGENKSLRRELSPMWVELKTFLKSCSGDQDLGRGTYSPYSIRKFPIGRLRNGNRERGHRQNHDNEKWETCYGFGPPFFLCFFLL